MIETSSFDWALIAAQSNASHRPYLLRVNQTHDRCRVLYDKASISQVRHHLANESLGEVELIEASAREFAEVQARLGLAVSAESLQAEVLLEHAVAIGASDIHLDFQANGLAVRYRIDGVLSQIAAFPVDSGHRLIEQIKVQSRIDIAKVGVPQDGKLRLTLWGSDVEFRVSTLPAALGESAVIRVLDSAKVEPVLKHLFHASVVTQFERCMQMTDGLIIVAGPTGAGKSTTLHAMLSEFNNGERCLISIEDPIERVVTGVRQTEVTIDSQPLWLRSALRQDPDVIVVGEIRDQTTAELALRASRSGHLVLCTLHVGHYPQIFGRFAEWGISRSILEDVLRAVIVQRLLRRNCDTCLGEGCPRCRQTGYFGRVGIAELDGGRDGTGSLRDYAMNLVALGLTRESEVQRVLGHVA